MKKVNEQPAGKVIEFPRHELDEIHLGAASERVRRTQENTYLDDVFRRLVIRRQHLWEGWVLDSASKACSGKV